MQSQKFGFKKKVNSRKVIHGSKKNQCLILCLRKKERKKKRKMSLCDPRDEKELKPTDVVPFSSGLVMNATSLGGVDTTLIIELTQSLPSRNFSIIGFVGDGGSQTFQSDTSVF